MNAQEGIRSTFKHFFCCSLSLYTLYSTYKQTNKMLGIKNFKKIIRIEREIELLNTFLFSIQWNFVRKNYLCTHSRSTLSKTKTPAFKTYL